MKEIKKERTTTQTYYEYEAIDGTIFNDKDTCAEYEKTLKCINQAKYNNLIIKKDCTEYDLFGVGSEDDYIDLIKVKSQDDIDIVMKTWMSYRTFYQEDKYKKQVDNTYNMLKKAMEVDDIIFVNHGYECNDFWFIGTQHGMIDRMMSLSITDDKNKRSIKMASCTFFYFFKTFLTFNNNNPLRLIITSRWRNHPRLKYFFNNILWDLLVQKFSD